MIVSIIVAMGENGAIGLAGGLPWRLSADLRRFKQLTMGHHLVLGRRTYQSLGRPLPGRRIIVLTRNPAFQASGCQTAGSLDEALAMAQAAGETEAFIGGGAGVYAAALPLAGRMYLTRVHARPEADTYFPAYQTSDWDEIQAEFHPANEKNQYPFTFQILERRSRS